jgi:hypothetical protein
MKGTRWSETRDALLEIADHAFRQDSAEVDIRFFNSSLVYRGIKVLFTLLLPVRNFDLYTPCPGRRHCHVDIQSGGT